MTYVTRQLQPQDLFFFLLVNKIQVGKVKKKDPNSRVAMMHRKGIQSTAKIGPDIR